MDASKVAFIDTETTGLDPHLCPVWEVAVIVDDVEHCWQIRVPALTFRKKGAFAPREPYLDEYADDVCHFLDRHVHETALHPLDSAAKFADLVKGRHLVGAVVSFDEERLRALHRQYLGPVDFYPWHYHLIDVEALAVGYLSSMRHAGLAMVGDVLACEVGEPGPVDLPWKSDELSAALGIECPSDADRHTALGDARWARAIYEVVCA